MQTAANQKDSAASYDVGDGTSEDQKAACCKSANKSVSFGFLDFRSQAGEAHVGAKLLQGRMVKNQEIQMKDIQFEGIKSLALQFGKAWTDDRYGAYG